MRRLQIAAGILALLLLVGCAAAPTAEKKDVRIKPVEKPAKESLKLPLIFKDRDLFLEGIALLNHPGRPDPAKARRIFSSMVQNHPQSQWRAAAETLIRLIDETEASQEKSRQDHLLLDKAQAERAKTLRENDYLRKTIRDLTEKHQTETTALTQENEQIKKDLQHLKALEIELQKRERMLR